MEEICCNCGHRPTLTGIKSLTKFIRTSTITVIIVLLLGAVHTDSVKDPTLVTVNWRNKTDNLCKYLFNHNNVVIMS